MAITDTTRKNEASGTAAPRQFTINSTAAGSLIVVGVSAWRSGANPTISVADNVNGSYGTPAFNAVNSFSRAAVFYFPNNAGGNLTITLTSDGADYWFCGHEFAGAATASPLSGTPATNTGTSLAPSSGSFTPSDNDVLLIAVVDFSQVVNAGGWAINQGGVSGFATSNDNTGSSGSQNGSMVWKVVSGSPGSVSHSWAVTGTSGAWSAGIAAFKPGGPAARQFILTRPA